MSETLCPKCKNPNRMSARFCATCGAPLLAGVTGATPIPTDTVPLSSGTVLQGRYRIEGLLGKGGFGAVYRTWDLSLSRMCAVKENLDVSPEAQRQFAREATVLAGLNHPNLPRVTDHFIISGQGQYLVMDFVEGDDLISMVEHHGLPPVEQTLTWLGQVMDALIYLHNRQPPVIHRDIKPANIRITPDSRAMLVDFGLVKASDPHLKTTLGARAVTPGYSPPEQYGQGHTDSRSDIYSLGATLYALLTGQDPPESVLRIGQDILTPPDYINPQIPHAVGRVILRAMALSPTQRYQTVANLKSDLNAAIAAAPSATVASGTVAPQTPKQTPYEPTVAMPDRFGPTSTPDHAGMGTAKAGSYSPTVSANVAEQAAPKSSTYPPGYGTMVTPPGQQDYLPVPTASDQAGPGTTAGAAKRNWAPVAVGIFLAGIVLALIALVAFWGWMDRTSQEEMQQTVDAGVKATRTAWAQPTSGVLLQDDTDDPISSLDPLHTQSALSQVLVPTPFAFSRDP